MTVTDTERPGRFDAGTPWHLQGNNAPITEELTETNLEIVGAIPSELQGRFFRNGANPQTGVSEHWFIGDGMLHGIELAGGKANWYRNRYVKTPMFANPGADRTELAMDSETFEMDLNVSAANTHVIAHAGRILALEEGAFPYEISPELETIGPFNYDGKLTTSMTAHPKLCPHTGELIFFGYGVLPPYFTYYRVAADGNVMQSTEITMGGPTMIHDFAVSRNHTVIMDLPMVFDLELALQGGMPIRWSDDYQARMGVMPRAGQDVDVKWFDIDPCYVFHTLNAHDDGDEVVMRGCRLEKLWLDTADMVVDEATVDQGARLHEWRFNMKTGAVSDRQLDDAPCEFPRIADADAGTQERYGYVMAQRPQTEGGAVFKYDQANGASKTVHEFGDGKTPGEPVFVAAADAKNSDDGWLMTFVHDAVTDTSALEIIDATDMAAGPVAEIKLPVRVPTGFHGSWIADA